MATGLSILDYAVELLNKPTSFPDRVFYFVLIVLY